MHARREGGGGGMKKNGEVKGRILRGGRGLLRFYRVSRVRNVVARF